MHFRGFVCACVLLAVVPLSDAWLKDLSSFKGLITTIHNYYRRQERAADMKELVWDPKLQRKAEVWSENCYWGHQQQGLGENLAYFWTTGPEMATLSVILRSCQNWWREVADWQWSTDCGAACHYTQMIWGKTERIGCALSKCAAMSTDSGQTINNANYFVCFYDPPGNFIGRHPYTMGDACSRCDYGDTCSAGLCSKTRAKGQTTNNGMTRPQRQATHNVIQLFPPPGQIRSTRNL